MNLGGEEPRSPSVFRKIREKEGGTPEKGEKGFFH